VFGGDVSDWYSRIGGFGTLAEDEYLVSGDLNNATDLFYRDIPTLLLMMIAIKVSEIMGESPNRLFVQMIRITTHADFKVGKSFVKQKTGQMMGSVLSFPLLCIMSLTTYICSLSHYEINPLFGDRGWKWLKNLKSVGINGDDTVFKSNMHGVEKWMKAVDSIGGVVSRGKTLVNKHYFTINSELWNLSEKVNCLRPSLLTALTGDEIVSPQKQWLEFRNSALVNPAMEKIFNLVPKLNLDIPVSLGGLGLVKNFDGNRMFDFWKTRETEKFFTGVILGSEKFESERVKKKEELRQFGARYECWVTKDKKDAFSRVYNSKYMNFRLKPHEIRFCLTEMLRSDIFKADYLKPFKQQFMDLEFPNIKVLEENFQIRKRDHISRLRKRYDLLMSDRKSVKIPSTLIQSYEGLVEEDIMAEIASNDEIFRIKYGSKCGTDTESWEIDPE
jgi:hypothetical protein